MEGRAEERWQELCRQAAVEQDPAKLLELVREITTLLEEKHRQAVKAPLPPEERKRSA